MAWTEAPLQALGQAEAQAVGLRLCLPAPGALPSRRGSPGVRGPQTSGCAVSRGRGLPGQGTP